jgi:hypothetical protein
MATKMESTFTGLFDQAVEAMGESMKAGVKFQEDLARWWSDVLDQNGAAQDWQKHTRAMVSEMVPAAQKNAEEWMRLMEENYRRSMELFRKAFDSSSMTPPSSPTDMQARTQQLWEASIEVIRQNAQAMAQANSRMMQIWSDIMRRNMNGFRAAERATERAAERATRTVASAAKSAAAVSARAASAVGK